jgi:hypothetical protein
LPVPEWLPGTPPQQKLRDFVRAVLTHMLAMKMPWQMEILLRELYNPTEHGKGLVRDFIRPIYSVLWSVLREALGPEVPEEKIRLLGFSIIGQCFYQRVARNVIAHLAGEEEFARYSADYLADHIASFSLAGLACAAAPINEAVAGEAEARS